jgi:hypothetical protein
MSRRFACFERSNAQTYENASGQKLDELRKLKAKLQLERSDIYVSSWKE